MPRKPASPSETAETPLVPPDIVAPSLAKAYGVGRERKVLNAQSRLRDVMSRVEGILAGQGVGTVEVTEIDGTEAIVTLTVKGIEEKVDRVLQLMLETVFVQNGEWQDVAYRAGDKQILFTGRYTPPAEETESKGS